MLGLCECFIEKKLIFICSSFWITDTETITSATTNSWSDGSPVISDITSVTPSFTETPTPTSKSSSDFVYVEYEDYDEYSSFEEPVVQTETLELRSTAPPSPEPSSLSPENVTSPEPYSFAPVQTPHLEPSIPTPNSAGADPTHIPSASAGPENLVNSTLLGGQRWQIKVYPTDPSISSSSFIPQTKTENNSVDEVLYQIVEEDRDNTRRHQNYFVPRMPPFRERTQNKRIQQLLNEKRRQNLLKRVNHNKEK